MSPDAALGQTADDEGTWVSVADLMAGLMMIFLFLAIMYITNLKTELDTYKAKDIQLFAELKDKFEPKLKQWGMEIDKGVVRFKSPEVLFFAGSDKLQPRFEIILAEFIPEYLDLLNSDKYRGIIKEVRVEGHTSSEWISPIKKGANAYFMNMELSQDRTRAVLMKIFNLPTSNEHATFLREKLTALGMSSSRLRKKEDETEDVKASRRVEFRIVTDSIEKFRHYIETAGKSYEAN